MLEPRGADSRNGVVPTHTSASLFYYSTVIAQCGSTCYQVFYYHAEKYQMIWYSGHQFRINPIQILQKLMRSITFYNISYK